MTVLLIGGIVLRLVMLCHICSVRLATGWERAGGGTQVGSEEKKRNWSECVEAASILLPVEVGVVTAHSNRLKKLNQKPVAGNSLLPVTAGWPLQYFFPIDDRLSQNHKKDV